MRQLLKVKVKHGNPEQPKYPDSIVVLPKHNIVKLRHVVKLVKLPTTVLFQYLYILI